MLATGAQAVRRRWRRRAARSASGLAALIVGACALTASTGATSAVNAAGPAIPAPTTIAITATGFTPAYSTVAVGQTIIFDNETTSTQTVSAGNGLFASGPIPPGGGYAVAIPDATSADFSSSSTPPAAGTLVVGDLSLAGPAGDLVSAYVPDLGVPPDNAAAVGFVPGAGVEALRTTILVGFDASATVAQANSAIASVGATLVGTIADAGLFELSIPDSGTFTPLEADITTLQAQPGVRFATLDPVLEPSSVTAPPAAALSASGSAPSGTVAAWTDDQQTPPAAGAPYNPLWGLNETRFPYAWNLLDAIAEQMPVVQTADIDSGFDPGTPDLASHATLLTLCSVGPLFCTDNSRVLNPATATSPAHDSWAHGTGTAGLIAGRYTGGNSVANLLEVPDHGTWRGLNPLVDEPPPDGVTALHVYDLVDLLLKQKQPGGQAPNLGVVNLSLTDAVFNRNQMTCPGQTTCTPNSDQAWLSYQEGLGMAAIGIADRASQAQVTLVVSAGNNSGGPVSSGANTSWCTPYGGTGDYTGPFNRTNCPRIVAQNVSSLAWADANWDDPELDVGLPDPIIVVEASDSDGELTFYSNTGGDVTAPGGAGATATAPFFPGPVTTAPGGAYQIFSGTSAAAPFVTALVGLLLEYQPNLSVADVRSLLLGGTVPVKPNPDAPADPTPPGLIDAFNSMLSVPNGVAADGTITDDTSKAAFDLADMSDPSADGDDRVVLGQNDTAIGPDTRTGPPVNGVMLNTAPDGAVDMRDFRRFRDAWLEACAAGLASADCPSAAQIMLPGTPDNAKADLNFDGCVYGATAGCQTPEDVFSRFDLVGGVDPIGGGGLDMLDTAKMPFDSTGQLVGFGSGETINSLQLLQQEFGKQQPGGATPDTEGYASADLPRLMVSGDLQVHTDSFFNSGASSVTIHSASMVGGSWQDAPDVTATPGELDDVRVVTLPVDAAGSEVRVSASATAGAQQLQSTVTTTTLHPGQQTRVDLCAASVTVTADPAGLTANSTGQIKASVNSCDPSSEGNLPVAFSVAPANPAGTSTSTTGSASSTGSTVTTDSTSAAGTSSSTAATTTSSTSVTTDTTSTSSTGSAGAQGQACPQGAGSQGSGATQASIASADSATDADGNATAQLLAGPNPGTVTVTVTVTLADGQTLTGTANVVIAPELQICYRWQETVQSYTRTEFIGENPSPEAPVPIALTRSGVVSFTPSGATLDEAVGADEYGWSGTYVGGQSGTYYIVPFDFDYEINPDDRTTTDYPLTSVSALQTPSDLTVSGLKEISDVPYLYLGIPVDQPPGVPWGDRAVIDGQVGNSTMPYNVLDADASGDLSAQDTFLTVGPRQCNYALANPCAVGDGTSIQFAPSVDAALTLHRNADGSWAPYDWCSGNVSVSFPADDFTFTDGGGGGTYSIAFTATVISAGSAPTLTLPDCANPPGPTASFSVSPTPAMVGGTTQFTDTSSDLAGITSWSWNFGDGTPAVTTQSPTHVFTQSGTYPVSLTVTDANGKTDTTTQQVVVAPVAPTVSIDDAAFGPTDTVVVHGRTFTPDTFAQLGLQVQISSNVAGFPTLAPQTVMAGPFDITVGTLAPGVYPISATVTDVLGQTATADATIDVTAAAPPAPPTPPPVLTTPGPACSSGVSVDPQVAALVSGLSSYRATYGLAQLFVSPTLTAAALAHAQDMAAKGYFSDTGSDGSTVAQRTAAAGYPSANVSELLAKGPSLGADVLSEWQLNGPDDAQLLNPQWEAIGVADVDTSSGWIWVADVGDQVDCPSTSSTTTTTTSAAATSTSTSSTAPATSAAEAAPLSAAPATSDAVALSATPDALVAPVDAAAALSGLSGAGPTAQAGAVTSLLPDPVPGVTISDLAPSTGTPVLITNDLLTGGVSAAATLGLGDDRPTVALAPGASTTAAWFTAGNPVISLQAASGTGATAQVPITVTGSGIAPSVSYTGAVTGTAGATADMQAKVIDASSSAPLAGAAVSFTLGGTSVTALTGTDGVATASLAIPADFTLGPAELTVSVSVGSGPAQTISAPFNVGGDTPPTADAGGPYQVLVNSPLVLDGSGSVSHAGSLTYGWDLSGSGAFTDATGAQPSPIPYATAQSLICGGTCVVGTAYPIALQVTDADGVTGVQDTTVTFVRDYSLSLTPSEQSLVPGASTTFAVDVETTSGFDQPVTLMVSGLPSGVTASFSSDQVTPDGISYLTLTAGSTISTGTSPINVTGTSGTLSHTTSTSVSLAFGLIPDCYGTLAGTVTDRNTGGPIAGATVGVSGLPNVQTSALGTYTLPDVPLGPDNAPTTVTESIDAPGYNEEQLTENVACNITTTANATLLAPEFGAIAGTVVAGTADPATPNTVAPTSTPISEALVTATGSFGSFPFASATAGSDGAFTLSHLPLDPQDNGTVNYGVSAAAAGYWSEPAQSVSVSAASTSSATVALVPICFGTINVRIVNASTGLPLPGASTSDGAGYDSADNALTFGGTANAEGVITLTNVPLGHNNAPATYTLTPYSPPGLEAVAVTSATASLSSCGSTATVQLGMHVPVNNYGNLDGTVTDASTGKPISGASVYLGSGSPQETGADGSYAFNQVFVGTDATTQLTESFGASAPNYYPDEDDFVTISSGQTTSHDVELVPMEDTTVQGTVTNSVTGAPEAGIPVLVDGNTTATTNSAGFYSVTGEFLGTDNAPAPVEVSIQNGDGYWGSDGSGTVTANGTTTINLQVLPACSPASINGVVVNATTGAPIDGATVDVFGASADDTVQTDSNGFFSVTGLVVLDDGATPLSVTASAPGFNSETLYPTIFCGAVISLNFGTPSSVTGTITGKVSAQATGLPVADAFIGSSYGGSATTNADGDYSLGNVPLGANGASENVTVTAIPPNGSRLAPASKSVLAGSGTTTLDLTLPAMVETTTSSATTTSTSLPTTTTTTTIATSPPTTTTTTSTVAPASTTTSSTAATSTTSLPPSTSSTRVTTTSTTTAASTTTASTTSTTPSSTFTTAATTVPTITTNATSSSASATAATTASTAPSGSQTLTNVSVTSGLTRTSSAVPLPPALACTSAAVVLMDVVPDGSRVLVSGAARAAYTGRRVLVRLTASGQTVGQATVGADGTFTTSVPLPPLDIRFTNRARYEAILGAEHSDALKLERRAYMTSAERSGDTVRLAGFVTGEFRPGALVEVTLRRTCGLTETVARVRLGPHGHFEAVVPAPIGVLGSIAVYRAQTTVLDDGHVEPTFTLPRPPS